MRTLASKKITRENTIESDTADAAQMSDGGSATPPQLTSGGDGDASP